MANKKANAPTGKPIDVAGLLNAATTDGWLATANQLYYSGNDKSVEDELDDIVNMSESFQKQIDDIVSYNNSVYHIIENDTYLLAIMDKDDNCLGGITRSGRWVIPDGISDEAQRHINDIRKILAKVSDTLDNEIVERKEIIRTDTGSYAWAIADKNENVWLAGLKDGTVLMPCGIPEEVKPLLKDAFQRLERLESFIKTAENLGVLGAFIDNFNNTLCQIWRNGDFEIVNKLKTQTGMSISVEETDADTLYHIVDKDGLVLFNIKRNGQLVGSNGIILDGLKSGISFVDSQKWLFAIVDNNRNVLGGIDKNGATFANSISGVFEANVIEDYNYLLVFRDFNGNILFGVRKDGSFFANSVVIDGIPTTEENPTFLYVILDKNRKVLWGIMRSGNVYQPKGIPEEVRVLIDKLTKSMEQLQEKIDYVSKHGADWTDELSLELPIPDCCPIVEINGDIPTSKFLQRTATLTYKDKFGNRFTKPIMWNVQGNVSSGFDKKNFAIDLFNDIINDESFEIKFGNWIPQDSYHLKAYYSDFWKLRSLLVYRHAEQISQARDYYKRRPWWNLIGCATQTPETSLQGGIGEVTQDIFDGALGRPDGFPFMLYINGVPWGLYIWAIKKSKENYNVPKNDANGEKMCFGDRMTGVFQRYNNDYWSIYNYSLRILEGDTEERSITIFGYSSTSVATVIMEAPAPSGGLIVNITNESKTYSYPVYFNGDIADDTNTWEAGACVKLLRAGTSDSYHFEATVIADKWDESKDYNVNDYCYDEEEVNFSLAGVKSLVVVRRLFKCITAYKHNEDGNLVDLNGNRIVYYRTLRPSYINWRQLEVRNPKTTICIEHDGSLSSYDYDSPVDYSQTGYYERTHEIISSDLVSQSQATSTQNPSEAPGTNFSKKEYTRSVNARKSLEEYSFVCPILEGYLTEQNLTDWGITSELIKNEGESDLAFAKRVFDDKTLTAKKMIFDEHHDIDFNIDFFLVYNDTYYIDSITHNTLYTMYDGKKLVANLYDTDISFGMGATYINSFPSVNSSVATAGKTFVDYLWRYHQDDIKARWAEYRRSGVITASGIEKLVRELVANIGTVNYEEDLRLWTQPSYRGTVYWRMPAGALKVLYDKDGLPYHGYEEDLNKAENAPKNTQDETDVVKEYDPEKQYYVAAAGVRLEDSYCIVGKHYYQCTVANKGQNPEEHYTCGSPTSGGVYDSPRRVIDWFTKRLSYLDSKFGYEEV